MSITPEDCPSSSSNGDDSSSSYEKDYTDLSLLKRCPPRMIPVKLEDQDFEVDFEYVVNTKQNVLPFLGLDCMVKIMEYLPLGDLNRISCTSGMMRKYVTVELIVKAALFQGGDTMQTIKNLYELIHCRSIHPITHNGLWEILQTKKCNICKNVKTRKKNNSVRYVRANIGINICWNCIRSRYTSGILKVGETFESNVTEYNIALDSQRTASKKIGKREIQTDIVTQLQWAERNGIEWRYVQVPNEDERYFIEDRISYLLSKPFYNSWNELSGPIVTASHIKSLVNIMSMKTTQEEKEDAYNQYLQEKCEAPSVDHWLYCEFENAYDATWEQAKEADKCRKLNRLANSEKWRVKKLVLATKFIDKIKCEINNPKHIPLLNYKVDIKFAAGIRGQYIKRKPILMTNRWVNYHLGPYLCKTSAHQSKQEIKRITNELESIADNDDELEEMELDVLKTDITPMKRYILQDYWRGPHMTDEEWVRKRGLSRFSYATFFY